MEKYSSGLVSESFWFIEFKKIIKLRNEGKSWDDIRDLCLNCLVSQKSIEQNAFMDI